MNLLIIKFLKVQNDGCKNGIWDTVGWYPNKYTKHYGKNKHGKHRLNYRPASTNNSLEEKYGSKKRTGGQSFQGTLEYA
jgi:hypothetical protein